MNAKEINRAINNYRSVVVAIVGGKQRRVCKARTQKGVLQVQVLDGKWRNPSRVWTTI